MPNVAGKMTASSLAKQHPSIRNGGNSTQVPRHQGNTLSSSSSSNASMKRSSFNKEKHHHYEPSPGATGHY